MYDELLSFSSKNNLNVRMMGFLSGQLLIDFYHSADFFILTSLNEPFGLVFLEAMAAGLPIITIKNLEGIQDIYTPEAFVLIDDYTSKAILNGIKKAQRIRWDKEKIKKHAKLFMWENISKEYLNLFGKIINNTRS